MVEAGGRTWWTVRDLAEAAGVTGAYVRLLLANGTLKGEKVNPRLWMIKEEEARRWLASREVVEKD